MCCHLKLRRLSFVCHLSQLCLYLSDTMWHVWHIFHGRKDLWVRMARKARWLAYCKIQPDVVEHPGTSGILHFTYYALGHTKPFSGILNSKVVWVLERRGCRLQLSLSSFQRPVLGDIICFNSQSACSDITYHWVHLFRSSRYPPVPVTAGDWRGRSVPP